jgi:hypothetical protein
MRHGARPSVARRLVRGALRVVAAVALAADAYWHARLAGRYDGVGTTVSQGALFRAEAALAALAALLVLVVRRRLTDLYAWLVAGGGLALLLVYRYVDVGRLGPVPRMYEPRWYRDKYLTALSLAVAFVATTLLLVTHRSRGRRGARAERPLV